MRNKFNYFFHLVLHLPFAMAMFWGPFLRVCLGPRAPTWGSAAPGESKSTDPPTVEKCRPGASRKVPPPKLRVKQSQAFQDGIISKQCIIRLELILKISLKWNSGTFC